MGNEHVIPEFIDRMKKLKGKNFKIQGTGDEVRSFIFIKDFINAFKLIQKKGKHLQIYNIGTNQKIRIKDLAKKISKILNKDIIIKTNQIPVKILKQFLLTFPHNIPKYFKDIPSNFFDNKNRQIRSRKTVKTCSGFINLFKRSILFTSPYDIELFFEGKEIRGSVGSSDWNKNFH